MPIALLPYITADKLLQLEIPPPKPLCGPIEEASIGLLFAKKGLGKTTLAMEIALATATGKSLLVNQHANSAPNWISPKARKVLYIDGEMNAGPIKGRAALQAAGRDISNLCCMFASEIWQKESADMNLSADEWRVRLDMTIGEIQPSLIILDNLDTLTYGINDNSKRENEPFAKWLLSLRARGIAVLQIHHAGKDGAQRGSSFRENISNYIIKIARTGSQPGFDVSFDKSRDLVPELTQGWWGNFDYDKRVWSFKTPDEGQLQRLLEIMETGAPFNAPQISQEMQCSRSYVYRLKKQAELAGLWSWGKQKLEA